MFHRISKCRLCQDTELVQVLDLGDQCFSGIFNNKKGSVPKAPLQLLRCSACGLVQLAHSVDPKILYGDTYGYRSGLNQTMVRHLKSIADNLILKYPPNKGDLIVDIGSNDGTLLKSYTNPQDYQLIGIDPLITKFKEFYPPHIETVPEFFSMWKMPRKAKIITSVAMLYDLEEPAKFAQQVASTLAYGGVWFFEVSYLPQVLQRLAYDSICHEHLEYYALKQIMILLRMAGMKAIEISFNDSNGGSIAITAAHEASNYHETSLIDYSLMWESDLPKLSTYQSFSNRIAAHKEELKALLVQFKKDGKSVLGYGASTKGNVLLQYCEFTSDDIPLIAEVNKDKVGCFTPGSEILIMDEETVKQLHPSALLVLPWHFRDGIIQKEQEYLKSGGQLIFPLPKLQIISQPSTP